MLRSRSDVKGVILGRYHDTTGVCFAHFRSAGAHWCPGAVSSRPAMVSRRPAGTNRCLFCPPWTAVRARRVYVSACWWTSDDPSENIKRRIQLDTDKAAPSGPPLRLVRPPRTASRAGP